MILNLTFHNPITNNIDNLILNYPNIDYITWKSIKSYYNDSDLINILNDILKNCDCTREYSCGRPCMTTYPLYNIYLSEYYYYLSKINNQFIYNKYIDEILKRHIDNIIFEYNNPNITIKQNKTVSNKKKLFPNKFVKQVTHDLFTNKEVYIYINLKTKEKITSDDPNLLDKLNSKKENKVTKNKNSGVPISSMTFSFKKK